MLKVVDIKDIKTLEDFENKLETGVVRLSSSDAAILVSGEIKFIVINIGIWVNCDDTVEELWNDYKPNNLRYKTVAELMGEGWEFNKDGYLQNKGGCTTIVHHELQYLGNPFDDSIILDSFLTKEMITKEV